MRTGNLIVSTAIVLMLSINAFGATFHVPTEYETIQGAIDAASDGAVIMVADGTYTGEGNRNVDFCGKAITVQSENGPENCIIDCEQKGRGFNFHQEEGKDAILRGFTITNGYGYYNSPEHTVSLPGGGAIHCKGASPTIENCILRNNDSSGFYGHPVGYGGGIYMSDASPDIIACRIFQNQANAGAGIFCRYSSPRLSNSIISHNTALDTMYINPILGKDVAMYCVYSSPVLINCTLAANRKEQNVEKNGILNFLNSAPILINCIVWGNQEGALIFGENSSPEVSYSDIQGGFEGKRNIDADPLFADASAGDYRLLPESPCIDTGTGEDAPDVDINNSPRPMGAGFDMGAYEVIVDTPDPVHPDDGGGDSCFIGTIVH